MIRAGVLLLLCAIVSAEYAPAAGAAEPATAEAGFQFTGNRVSIHLQRASLQELLRGLAAQYPFDIRLHGSLDDTRRDWHVDDQPLVDVLRRLLRDYSAVMYFDSGGAGASALTRLDIHAGDAASAARAAGSHTAPPSGLIHDAPSHDQDPAYREVQKLDGLRDERTVDLLAQALESSDSREARLHSLQLLAELDTDQARQKLLSALGDEDENVRVAAVTVLSRWQNEEALRTLGQVLYGDAASAVRVAALQGLARLDGAHRPAARSFLEAAVGDPDESVARAASSLIDNMDKR